jgi:septum formation protein
MSDPRGEAGPKLILASRSPRRRELLHEAGYRFEVCAPAEEIEEGLRPGETPAELVARLAFQKAADVVGQVLADQKAAEATEGDSPIFAPRRFASVGRKSGQSPVRVAAGWILGCDTVVECEGRILGKPADREEARQMLRALSGRLQRVLTGLCLWPAPHGQPQVRVATTTLRMDPLSAAQLEGYLASGQWEGKAGAFGYQDRLGWVHVLQGSESNVVGLPLELLAEMLDSASAR